MLVLSCGIGACTQIPEFGRSPRTPQPTAESLAEKPLTIWWDKGFTLEEDEALEQLVRQWENRSGHQAKLTFYTTDELPQKAQRAIQAGNPPDVLMSNAAERELNPRLAWQGKLVDVSEVIEPIKALYPESVLAAVHLYNQADRTRSYYAVPINQATIHISYWQDSLQQVGRTQADIPRDWDGFWQFWQQIQDDLRSQQSQTIYGLGLPVSTVAGDTYQVFEQILEAYDVQLVDAQGRLRVDRPEVRQGIVKSLTWYTNFYRQGYVPPAAVKWLNPDNNRSFLNHQVVMTPNLTLSIPVAVRQDRDRYLHKLGTLDFPNKPSGKPMCYLIVVRQAVIFADSRNHQLAKAFLSYLIQPEIIGNYLKLSGGRNLPVLKPLWKDPFWADSTDPHRAIATKQLLNSQTRPYYYVQNPAYSLVLEENVWGKALSRIVEDNLSPEQATDAAIRRIKQIFSQWQ